MKPIVSQSGMHSIHTKKYFIYRSRDFRPAYSHLAELRAMVPSHTPVMACIATATKSDKIDVLENVLTLALHFSQMCEGNWSSEVAVTFLDPLASMML